MSNAAKAELEFVLRTADGDRRTLGKSASLLAKTVARLALQFPCTLELARALSGERFLPLREGNAGVFLKHLRKGYACGLSAPDRARIIEHHYRRLVTCLGTDFLRGSIGNCVVLWSANEDPQGPRIIAQTSSQFDFESELNLFFMLGSDILYKMGFVLSPGDIWDLEDPAVLVVTRVQGVRLAVSQMKIATELSGDCAPRLLLFAALEGLAAAMGIQRIVGIGVTRQIATAFGPIATASFHDNYDGFWESLSGIRQSDGTYLLPLPLAHRPLTAIPAKHRSRAHNRRMYRAMLTSAVASLFV